MMFPSKQRLSIYGAWLGLALLGLNVVHVRIIIILRTFYNYDIIGEINIYTPLQLNVRGRGVPFGTLSHTYQRDVCNIDTY